MANNPYTEEDITRALMACVAWAGNATEAAKSLQQEGHRSPTRDTLSLWMRDVHADRYNALREKYSAQMEAQLAHEYRDVSRLAAQVQREALEKARVNLEKGQDRDPARSAANAATVAQKMTDKLLSLTGRPTQITESRNLGEILRSLAAKGVIDLQEQQTITEGSDAG